MSTLDKTTADAGPATKIFREAVGDVVTECSLAARGEGNTCAPTQVISIALKSVKAKDLSEAKKKTGCDNEKCVIASVAKMAAGENVIEISKSLSTDYKISGPTTDKLLSNTNIDNILAQWSRAIPGFFAYNFNMIDYAKYSWRNSSVSNSPDTLATINLQDIICTDCNPAQLSQGVVSPGVPLTNPKYNTAGCVINSDSYQNSGKHWMALFVDTRGTNWSVEFFNSSGNSPAPEWVNWLSKSRSQLESLAESRQIPAKVTIGLAVGLRQQNSKSECGVYSLFYIWARLAGIPYETFKKVRIPDKYMFEFRQHLYTGEIAVDDSGKFNWAEYQQRVPISWEASRPSH